MRNCIDCKNAVIKFEDSRDLEEDMKIVKTKNDLINSNMLVKCLKGNSEKIRDFYIENGNLPKSESENTILNCFEATEFSNKLDNLVGILAGFLGEVDIDSII